MTKKRNVRQTKTTEKAPLTYAITAQFAPEIREYIDKVHEKTGLPKSRIATNLLFESVRRAKKFYPVNSENLETVGN